MTPPPPKSPQHAQAIALLLLATLFWGLSFPLIKAIAGMHELLLPGSSTWFVTACTLAPRFALGALVLAAVSFNSLRTLTRSEWRQSLGLGLFAAAGMIFQNDGLLHTSASTSAFLTQFYAIMIPVWLAFRARRNPSATVWVSCVLVIAGVAVFAQLDWQDLRLGRGELETLIASVFFAGQILWLDREEFAGNRALPVTTVMFVIVGVVASAMALLLAPDVTTLWIPWTSAPWVTFTLALTIFSTVGAYTLMNAWQPKITATEAGLIYCIEPVAASLMALFLPAWLALWGGFDYPNEVATTHLLIGGGLITAANILIQLRPPPKHFPPR